VNRPCAAQHGSATADEHGVTESIAGILASPDIAAIQGTQPAQQTKGPFAAVSNLLGMSADDIAAAVKSGTSLDQLAQQKGVSHDDLIAALKAGAPQRLQSDPNVDQILNNIASSTGRTGWHGHHHHHDSDGGAGAASGVMSGSMTSAQQTMLSQLSSLLGTTPDDLQSSLQSGTSLASLLDNKGVSLDQLANSLQSGFLVDVKA
jgi:lambda repressor-like predicted transcriptional regulator